VNEVDALFGFARWAVDADADVRLAVRPGNRAVLFGDVRVVRHLDAGEHRLDGRPSLHDVGDGVETTGECIEQLIQGDAYFSVDQFATRHLISFQKARAKPS
jgi:hypothetical protein